MANIPSRTLTTELVIDFIDHRLKKAGHEHWTNGNNLKCQSLSNSYGVAQSLRIMGDEFHAAYFNAFQDMISTINIHGEDLKEIIYKIFDVTCETGIEWGRLIGFFVFSSMLSVKAMDCNRTDVVDKIIIWTSDYLEDKKYSNWINQHNGWDGFVQFYRNPILRHEDDDSRMLSKAYNVGAHVFTGVATVAKFLMH